MSFAITEYELHRACEIIFGPELAVTREFLEYLQPSGIKSAYRKRAMETHPDRLAASNDGPVPQPDNELFHAVQRSYEHLLDYLKAREAGFRLPQAAAPRPPAWRPTSQPKPAPRPKPSPNRQKGRADFQHQPNASRPQQETHRGRSRYAEWGVEQLYSGPLPNRRLLLGHFLYYSGIASWRMIVQALVWQRTQRPRLGELGQRYGLLREEEVEQILRSKAILEPFGASAVAQGYLTASQVQVLIHQQKRLQRKFGEYFVEQNILRPEQLAALLQQYHEHNARLAEELGLRFRL